MITKIEKDELYFKLFDMYNFDSYEEFDKYYNAIKLGYLLAKLEEGR